MSTPELSETSQCLKTESLDVTMANLYLGPLCQCSVGGGRCCKCKPAERNYEKRNTTFPEFWRKTLSNKILDHKTKFNKKNNKLSYEVLKPSKLKFMNPVENSAKSNGVQLFTSPEVDLTGSASEGNLVKPSLSLPDLNSLRIRSQTDLSVTKTKNASMDFARLSTLQWVKKPPKWKSRAKLNLKECRLFSTLATIPEDTDTESSGSVKSQASCPQSPQPNSNTPQSCSQQALTESSDDITCDELASYFDLLVQIPKKMSPMAEMMYT